MSDEESKYKHSKRRHKNETAVEKQFKIVKNHGLGSEYQYEKHRLVKHHGLNCGNPNCVMCANPRKVFGEKTIQEKRAEQDIDRQTDRRGNGTYPPEDD